jgi:hypothetical protein
MKERTQTALRMGAEDFHGDLLPPDLQSTGDQKSHVLREGHLPKKSNDVHYV